LLFFFLHHVDGEVGEVTDDGFHVTTHIAYFGEFRRFHFNKRRLRELRQTARDLSLADPGRADHDDVLRHDLLAQVIGNLLTTPAIA
jgi:hypothetical protein